MAAVEVQVWEAVPTNASDESMSKRAAPPQPEAVWQPCTAPDKPTEQPRQGTTAPNVLR